MEEGEVNEWGGGRRRVSLKLFLSKKRLNKKLRQIATEACFLNNLKFPHDVNYDVL